VGKYKIFRIEKCFAVGVSRVSKMFHAPKMMASFTGKPFGKGKRNLLSLRAKTYCSTNLLTQEVSQQLRFSMLSRTDFLNFFQGWTNPFSFSYLRWMPPSQKCQ